MAEVVKIKNKEYWTIRFGPAVVEWQFIISKLLQSVKIEAYNDWLMSFDEETGDIKYMLNKERYPAALIAKTFGLTEERVRRLNDDIVLDAPKANEKVPKPTVSGWGTA